MGMPYKTQVYTNPNARIQNTKTVQREVEGNLKAFRGGIFNFLIPDLENKIKNKKENHPSEHIHRYKFRSYETSSYVPVNKDNMFWLCSLNKTRQKVQMLAKDRV